MVITVLYVTTANATMLSSTVTLARMEDTGRPEKTKLAQKAANNNGEIVSDHKSIKALLAFLILT